VKSLETSSGVRMKLLARVWCWGPPAGDKGGVEREGGNEGGGLMMRAPPPKTRTALRPRDDLLGVAPDLLGLRHRRADALVLHECGHEVTARGRGKRVVVFLVRAAPLKPTVRWRAPSPSLRARRRGRTGRGVAAGPCCAPACAGSAYSSFFPSTKSTSSEKTPQAESACAGKGRRAEGATENGVAVV
jgi:hypothetical protein